MMESIMMKRLFMKFPPTLPSRNHSTVMIQHGDENCDDLEDRVDGFDDENFILESWRFSFEFLLAVT